MPLVVQLPPLPEIRLALRQPPQQLPRLLVRLLVLLDAGPPLLDRALVVLRKVLAVDLALRAGGDQLEGLVADDDGQAELQVHDAALAGVLEAGARQADVGAPLAPVRPPVARPAEHGEGPRAQLALGAVVLLEHLDVGVLGQAVLAHRGEVGGFPPGPVEVLFDLGGHGGGVSSSVGFGRGGFW